MSIIKKVMKIIGSNIIRYIVLMVLFTLCCAFCIYKMAYSWLYSNDILVICFCMLGIACILGIEMEINNIERYAKNAKRRS